MSFWGSILGGSNPILNSTINQTGSLAGYSSNLGQQNTNAGSGFFNSLLSGDPSRIAQTLAPEISAMQQGGQQQKNAIAQFGTRSGGANAATQGIDVNNRAALTNLIGGLQSGAASSLLNSGQNLLGTALSGLGQQAQLSQEQMANWSGSLFGGLLGGLGSAAGTAITGGLGKIPGLSAVL